MYRRSLLCILTALLTSACGNQGGGDAALTHAVFELTKEFNRRDEALSKIIETSLAPASSNMEHESITVEKASIDPAEKLRSAIDTNDSTGIKEALDHGASLLAVNSTRQSLLHLAASGNRFIAMQTLLSFMSCTSHKSLISAEDKNRRTAFSIAADFSREKQQTLSALVDFLLDDEGCEEILAKEIKSMLVVHKDQALQSTLRIMSGNSLGIEKIASLVYRFVTGQEARYFLAALDPVLQSETKLNVFARALYIAISSNNKPRRDALFSVVNALEPSLKKQVVGYMLFINSTNTKANFRTGILDEAEKLGLSRSVFDNTQSDITDLKATLDAVVIGQETAKVALAVAIRNHYRRLEQRLPKSNILILGPSGTGKTLMVQTIAQSLDVPFTVADASNITQAGYVGGKVKDAVAALAQKADYDLRKIERGIIFFDEIDKMAARSGRADSEDFKRQAQATLLKVIEGIELEVPVGDSKMTVNTSKILFVCAGAFTGLPEIIASRLKRDNKPASDDIFAQVASEDLIAYGLTPELLGRLPDLLTLRELTIDDLGRILKNPRSSVLEEFKTLFRIQNVELKFTDSAILAIAEKASAFKIGARALRTVVEQVMADLQFRIGHIGDIKSCTVTDRVIRYGDFPVIEYR